MKVVIPRQAFLPTRTDNSPGNTLMLDAHSQTSAHHIRSHHTALLFLLGLLPLACRPGATHGSSLALLLLPLLPPFLVRHVLPLMIRQVLLLLLLSILPLLPLLLLLLLLLPLLLQSCSGPVHTTSKPLPHLPHTRCQRVVWLLPWLLLLLLLPSTPRLLLLLLILCSPQSFFLLQLQLQGKRIVCISIIMIHPWSGLLLLLLLPLLLLPLLLLTPGHPGILLLHTTLIIIHCCQAGSNCGVQICGSSISCLVTSCSHHHHQHVAKSLRGGMMPGERIMKIGNPHL
jgi:hypothetical protein